MNTSPENRPPLARHIDVDIQWAEDLPRDAAVDDAELIEPLIAATLEYLRYPGDAEISVRLVNETEMADLNRRFRAKEGSTNVLAFPFESAPELNLPFLGDVVVCVPVLQREAAQQHKGLTQHFAHLLLHGTLHLMGFDHQTEEQALQMETTERDILKQFGIPDPYGDIAEQ